MTDRPTNPTDRPGLRPAAPVRASEGTPDRTDHRPTTTPAPTARPAKQPTVVGRFRRWRASRAATANGRKAATPTTDPAAVARLTAAIRPTTRPAPVESPHDIAPVPGWMRFLGVWVDRTFGAIPLAAPLIVSGDYTMRVFTAAPINAHPAVALAATCALEGGVWKLSRLYEKTLVAGDSTIALRAGIGGYLALISGLIYWHATRGNTGTPGSTLPAVGVAVMSALGVYIWSRTARWARRRELHAMGRVDTQAPKFAALAWVLCPVETPQALRHAVKYRIPAPVQAVESLRLFKASGRPAVWPPVADQPTADQSAPTAPADRAPTAPTVAAPTAPTTPVAPRPRQADQPTAPRPTNGSRPTTPVADQSAHTPAAVQNAADLRRRYGTRTDLKLGTIRSDTGWSFDRANPAFKAYLAGADRSVRPDRPAGDPDDDPTDPRRLAAAAN